MTSKYKNYTLIEEKYSEDTNSQVSLYEHNQTGAQVLLLDNDDKNNVFGIGFLTPPSDDTGVAHIVEHSTLSGSRKYHTKEPFMDLIQSSLQTFLNAMTFSDKTIYPVSSRNPKDFMNLCDVYLDAVFFPKMYEEKKIFQQEGWHYEFKDNKDLIYNGVVYNEMKGVYSDPDAIVEGQVARALHGETTYGFESGGHPRKIPDLTYEDFLNFHKKHYHPSNSYIYLYGNLDKAPILDYMDQAYLSKFSKKDLDVEIVSSPPLKEDLWLVKDYPTDDIEDGSYYTYALTMGESTNGKDLLLRSLFADLLVNSSEGDLKEALLEENFCKDVYVDLSTSLPLDFYITAKGAKPGQSKQFVSIIENRLKEIISKGFDKKRLLATFNKFEISIREGGGNHKGIIYYINALNTWLYGASPLIGLDFSNNLKDLRKTIENGDFEKLLEEKILKKPKLIIESAANTEALAQEQEDLAQELKEKKNLCTTDRKAEILQEQNELLSYQSTPDSKEAKATIPRLSLDDIQPGITHIPRKQEEKDGVNYLFHPQFTNGLSYLTLSSNIHHLNLDELAVLSLLTNLLGKISTENRSYKDLSNSIFLNSSGLSFSPLVYQDKKSYSLRLNTQTMGIGTKIKEVLPYLEDVLFHTKFTEEKRIYDLLLLEKTSNEASFLQNGHLIVSSRIDTHYSKPAKIRDLFSGLDYHFYLKDLLDHWTEKKDDFLKDLQRVYKKVFNRKELIVEFTGQEKDFLDLKDSLIDLASKYKEYPFVEINPKLSPQKEAFTLPASVVYISKGYDLNLLETPFVGSMTVLSNLLSTGFLHENIRAKGGAYGAGIRIKPSGLIATYSYRDPQFKDTIATYNKIGSYLENLTMDQEDIEQIIIGSINAFDPLRTPYDSGQVDLARFILKNSEEDLSIQKQEALATNLHVLKTYGPLLSSAMEKDHLVVLGSQDKIKENQEVFDKIYSI